MKKEPPPKLRIILHPFLFASFASLWLLANNITEIGLAGLRAIILSLVAALLIFIILKIVLKDGLKAGLCASGVILLIFSYGHVLDVLQDLFPRLSLSRGNILILSLSFALLGLWIYIVVKRLKNLNTISNYLNIVALVLNIFPIYTIATFSSQTYDIGSLTQEFTAQQRLSVVEIGIQMDEDRQSSELRDIYFIILDAYAREDVLKNLYNYDNSEFIKFLEERGFVVDHKARTNYIQTEYSIASSLNMMHIEALPDFLRERGVPDSPEMVKIIAAELIKKNLVTELFSNQGYEIVTFDSGYGGQIRSADVLLSSPEIEDANFWQVGFEFMLLDTTLGRELVNLLGEEISPHRKMMDAHRERVLFSLSNLSNFASDDRPQFVFAHILSPHVPYVFDRNGERITGYEAYTLLDAEPGNVENIKLYRDQLHYINTLIMETIDQILDKSDPTPIIILQADHGSKVYRELDPPTSVKMDLLLPILSASLFPDAQDEPFALGGTPVNNFRKVLNLYFDRDLELLEDASYMLEAEGGSINFIDACLKYEACGNP